MRSRKEKKEDFIATDKTRFPEDNRDVPEDNKVLRDKNVFQEWSLLVLQSQHLTMNTHW